jgi:phage shock protein A
MSDRTEKSLEQCYKVLQEALDAANAAGERIKAQLDRLKQQLKQEGRETP